MKRTLLLFLAVISYTSSIAQTVILDFETEATSTTFRYFESGINGTLNNIIPNPAPGGSNTSAMVADWITPADGQPWAGGIADPPITGGINTIGATSICMDVWFIDPGNVALKLENGSGPDWIKTLDVSISQQWTQICFDLNDLSDEDPFQPGIGNTYVDLVLFFDFLETVAEDKTYYWDNLVIFYGGATEAEATFNVDMSDYSGSVDTVFLVGSFNNWSFDQPMTDTGNNLWSLTDTFPTGQSEYLYYVKADDRFEAFPLTANCTNVTYGADGEVFINRVAVIVPGFNQTHCWESCFACNEGVSITFNLGFADNLDPADSVYVAGGGNFDSPGGRFLMQDNDGDGIYSITVERAQGFSSFYTFANGACPDFSCKENISGQDCADADNFNDRFLSPVMQDTVINTCFAECTDDTNCAMAQIVNVTLRVDMNEVGGGADGVFIGGVFTGWSQQALEEVEPGIFAATYEFGPGEYDYKFLNGPDGWESFNEGDPCTITFNDGSGNVFINRFLQLDGSEGTIEMEYCFNKCALCFVDTDEVVVDDNLFSIHPTLINENLVQITYDHLESLDIYTALGEKVLSYNPAHQKLDQLDLSRLSPGIYLVRGENENKIKVTKLIKQ